MEQRYKINQLTRFLGMKYLLSIILLFISGCMSPQPKVAETYPIWFNQTPQDSSSYYYAAAEGKDKNDAITKALNQIASKISISIESKFVSNTVVNNNHYNKVVQMDINNKVDKVHFNNYTIKNEQHLGKVYLISLEVNRSNLSQALKNKIKSRFTNISNELNMQYKNSVVKLKKYTKILYSLKSLQKKLYVLSSINNKISIKKYLLELSNIKDTISKFHDSVIFHIQGSSTKYTKVLYNAITQKGYKISKYHGLINLKMSISKKRINSLGYKIMKGIITLQVFDKKDSSLVGEKRLIIGGKSISSFTQADEFMLNSFRYKLETNKVLSKLLGI